MNDIWYFAYGSNMYRPQKEGRTSRIREGPDSPRIARLSGYRLAFNKRGGKGQLYANIIPIPGGEVIGVVYRCGPSTLDIMAEFEGGYDRKPVTVALDDGLQVEAITFIARKENTLDEARPSDEYLDKIINGAVEHGLPRDYIEKIRRLATGGNWDS